MDDAERFVVGQKALINKDGKVLVLNDPERGLDLPGGKIQVGEEDLRQALRREITEETSLEVEILDPINVGYWNKTRPTYFVFFKAKYKSGDVRISDEHDGHEWVGKEDLEKLDKSSSFYQILENYFLGA